MGVNSQPVTDIGRQLNARQPVKTRFNYKNLNTVRSFETCYRNSKSTARATGDSAVLVTHFERPDCTLRRILQVSAAISHCRRRCVMRFSCGDAYII